MNIPDGEDIVSQTVSTYNKIASAYCRKTRLAKYLDWEEKYIRKMIGLIGTSGPAILDVGCGDGRHCRLIEKNGGKATGIDLSQAMINEAGSYYPDGRFYLMDMRVLEFDDDTFDGIWSSGSIYHVKKAEVDRVLSEYRRVLNSGGVLSLNFKLGEGEGLEANPRSYGGAPRYFAYYSRDEMLALLAKHGFVEIESCLYPEEIFGDNILQIWLRINK